VDPGETAVLADDDRDPSIRIRHTLRPATPFASLLATEPDVLEVWLSSRIAATSGK
jgi:hypothetical protein